MIIQATADKPILKGYRAVLPPSEMNATYLIHGFDTSTGEVSVLLPIPAEESDPSCLVYDDCFYRVVKRHDVDLLATASQPVRSVRLTWEPGNWTKPRGDGDLSVESTHLPPLPSMA